MNETKTGGLQNVKENERPYIMAGEPHETAQAKIVRTYEEALNAGCFAHGRDCNIRSAARPGKGCDCELGKMVEAIDGVRVKAEPKKAEELRSKIEPVKMKESPYKAPSSTLPAALQELGGGKRKG